MASCHTLAFCPPLCHQLAVQPRPALGTVSGPLHCPPNYGCTWAFLSTVVRMEEDGGFWRLQCSPVPMEDFLVLQIRQDLREGRWRRYSGAPASQYFWPYFLGLTKYKGRQNGGASREKVAGDVFHLICDDMVLSKQ